MELASLVGSLAFISAFFLITSPIPSLYEGYKKMDTKSLTKDYLLIGCLQASLWTCYGLKLDDFYTCLANTCGVLLFTAYLNLYLFINRMMDKALLNNGIIVGALLVFGILFNGALCCLVATCVATCWQFTMIPTMKKAISSKDASFINLTISVVSLINFSLWAWYSLLIGNYLMFIPNFIGVGIWSLNLVIYAWSNSHLSHDNIIIKTVSDLLKIEINGVSSIDREKQKNNTEPLLKLKTSTGNKIRL